MTKIVLSFLLAGFALVASAQAGNADTAPAATQGKRAKIEPLTGEDALSRIDARGTLRVGVAVNAPWVMHDKNGELVGFSVDVAKKLAADMGWKVELVTTSWPKLLLDLRTDRSDVVISGLSITPQRARLAHFTNAYGEHEIGLVVNRTKYPDGDIGGFVAGKHRIGARAGTTTLDAAKLVFPNAEIVAVDDENAAIEDLRAGKLDGLVCESPGPKLLASIYPEQLRVPAGEPISRTAHGMAVRRGENDLSDVLDAWIVQAKASGWLKARSDYWFEGTEWVGQL
jgi:polar amino acid transport system substrate-binding protein